MKERVSDVVPAAVSVEINHSQRNSVHHHTFTSTSCNTNRVHA